MSRQLITFIMQTFVFAALILTGLGAQASQVVPAEHVQLQAHGVNVDSGIDNPCSDMAFAPSAETGGEAPAMDCDMDPADCHSACANCPATSNPAPSFHSAVAAPPIFSETLAVIAAQYPIDQPPKLLSSL